MAARTPATARTAAADRTLASARSAAAARFEEGGPGSVAGLILWLDAANVVGIADGAAVATWPDVSLGARHATQATGASQPLFIANGVNGRPILRFDATDDKMAGSLSGSGLVGSKGATLIVVAKFNLAGGTRALFDSSDNGATNRALQMFISGASLFSRWASGGASFAFSDTTAYHVFSLVHLAGTRTIYLDGTAQNTETATPALIATVPTTFAISTLTGGTFPATADIKMIAAYSRAMTAAEHLQQVRWHGAQAAVAVA